MTIPMTVCGSLFAILTLIVQGFEVIAYHSGLFNKSLRLIGTTFLACVAGLVGVFVGFIVSALISFFAPYHFEKTGEIQLTAFHDGTSVHGSLFCIRGEGIYRYYHQNDDGGIVYGQVSANDTTIYEEKRNDGILEIRQQRTEGKWKSWVLESDADHRTYRFLVPKGTVVRKYVADLN